MPRGTASVAISLREMNFRWRSEGTTFGASDRAGSELGSFLYFAPSSLPSIRTVSMNQLARSAIIVLIGLLLLPASGCVRRRLNVRSNPPGALVYVDNQQIGTTPCSVDFTYYGTREIRLIKPGYETLTVNQPIPTPWYEIPPLDFVSENLTPTKIRDNRTVTFDMAPQIIVPTEQLLDREPVAWRDAAISGGAGGCQCADGCAHDGRASRRASNVRTERTSRLCPGAFWSAAFGVPTRWSAVRAAGTVNSKSATM